MTTPRATTKRPSSPERALKILAILYGIAGGVGAIAGLYYVVMGVLGACGVISGGYFSGIVIVIGAALLTGSALWFTVCRMLGKRRGRIFCLVNGALILPLFIPIGTALGTFTLVLLSRQEVIDLFFSTAESRTDQA